MGNTINIAANWNVSNLDFPGKLELIPINEFIIQKICDFISNYAIQFPEESSIIFKHPLTWNSFITAGTFSKELIKLNETTYIMDKYDKSGKSWIIVNVIDRQREIKSYNILALAKILDISGNQKILEAKRCLESNPDPLFAILGAQFSSKDKNDDDDNLTTYLDYAFCITESNEEIEETKKFIHLVLNLKDYDTHLLKEVLNFMAKEIKLQPPEVDETVKIIQNMITQNPSQAILKSLTWMPPFTFVFDNGCRAPLWKQLYGDISYIAAITMEDKLLSITANSSGYYLNKREGFLSNSDEDYERHGDIYSTLLLLLKKHSTIFNSRIEEAINELKLKELNSALIYSNANENDNITFKTQKDISSPEEKNDFIFDCLDVNDCDPNFDEEGENILKNIDTCATASCKDKNKKNRGRRAVKKLASCNVRTVFKNVKLEKWINESSSEDENHLLTAEEEIVRNECKDGPPEKMIYNYQPGKSNMETKLNEFWLIQSMFQYIRSGNHCASLIGLCSISDLNLSDENLAFSIYDCGGVDLLVNLLDLNDFECQIASLKILKVISKFRIVWQRVINFKGVEIMIDLLHHSNSSIQCLAAECLGVMAKTKEARQVIRQRKGISKLVAFLDTHISRENYILDKGSSYYPGLPIKQLAKIKTGMIGDFLNRVWNRSLRLAASGSFVLASLANSKRTRKSMQVQGALPYLARLLNSEKVDLLKSVISIIAHFAKESCYRASILSEKMIPSLIKCFKMKDMRISEIVCSVFYMAGEDERIRREVHKFNGLVPIVELLTNVVSRDNEEDLIPVSGAVWKLCLSPENVLVFKKAGIIPCLVGLLNNDIIEIVMNTFGCLSQVLKFPKNRLEFDENGGLKVLLSYMTHTNPALLVQVTYALAQCAEETQLIGKIIENDGMRLLWSLLSNSNDDVVTSSAWALCPCLKTSQDSGHMVRSFMGGIEVLVNLLRSKNPEVLSAACGTIANVAEDEENLGILSQYKVVLLLSKLICTDFHKLKSWLAEAISQCCKFEMNRREFGKENVVVHLVKYLLIEDMPLQKFTTRALYQLSLDSENCITMHFHGCVPLLLKLVGSTDEETQEAASECISNIRRLALANQEYRARLEANLLKDTRPC